MNAQHDNSETPALPAGRYVWLPGRGRTFIREAAGPAGAPTIMLLHGWTGDRRPQLVPGVRPARRALPGGRPRSPRSRARHAGRRSVPARRLRRRRRRASPRCSESSSSSPSATRWAVRSPSCSGTGTATSSPASSCAPRAARSAGRSGRRRCSPRPPAPRSSPVRSVGSATPSIQTLNELRRRRGAGWWGFDQIAGHDLAAIVEAGRELGRFDSRSWIGDVDVPAAVVVTSDDDVVPTYRQRDLAARIRGAAVRVVAGGHSVCTTQPSRFVPTLVDACRAVVRQPAVLAA